MGMPLAAAFALGRLAGINEFHLSPSNSAAPERPYWSIGSVHVNRAVKPWAEPQLVRYSVLEYPETVMVCLDRFNLLTVKARHRAIASPGLGVFGGRRGRLSVLAEH